MNREGRDHRRQLALRKIVRSVEPGIPPGDQVDGGRWPLENEIRSLRVAQQYLRQEHPYIGIRRRARVRRDAEVRVLNGRLPVRPQMEGEQTENELELECLAGVIRHACRRTHGPENIILERLESGGEDVR